MHQFARQTDLLREELNANAERNTSLVAELRDRLAAEGTIKALFRWLVATQDQERRRISRDLHDQLGQPMTALQMTLDRLDASEEGDAGRREHVARAKQLAEDIRRSLHVATWELRPAGALERFGLATALENLVLEWSGRFGIAADFQGPSADTLRLPLHVAANVYGLVQEALHNVVKHAGARHVAVLLQARDQEAVVIVEDDGRGFDPAQVPEHSENQRLGLVSMRERAELCGGTFDIDAAPGRGTTIFVRIPVAAGQRSEGD
jgi:signal transduction histidine kinase